LRQKQTVEVELILLLFGPPGCGKGTQAVHLAERLKIPAISTGEIFRAECKAGTELGQKASQIMASGGLVGDDIVNGMVASRIARPDCAGGFLLDGYPRTVPQAEQFGALLRERGLPAPTVIHMAVAEDVLVARLTARRQCPKCLRIYNTQSQPPREAGRCDDDGEQLLTRVDDQEAVIRQRLAAYRDLTGPVLGFYGKAAVHTVDAALSPEEVTRAIEDTVLQTTAR
jgi:adenylate kinase